MTPCSGIEVLAEPNPQACAMQLFRRDGDLLGGYEALMFFLLRVRVSESATRTGATQPDLLALEAWSTCP